MLHKEQHVSPANTATVLKALLSGHEIETENGVFRYFRKGEWISISAEEEGEVAQEGIFKRCDVVYHKRHVTHSVDEGATEHRWLLWLNSLADFVEWTETLSPAEMSIITANLTLTSLKKDK